MSYTEHSLGVGSYLSAEMKSVYSTALANWADRERRHHKKKRSKTVKDTKWEEGIIWIRSTKSEVSLKEKGEQKKKKGH